MASTNGKTCKACKCKVELNHLDSMNLMLMEAIADKDWKSAETYRKIVKDQIQSVGKCANVDVSQAASHMDDAKKWIDAKEVRLPMRSLQDAFWLTIFKVCEGHG